MMRLEPAALNRKEWWAQ